MKFLLNNGDGEVEVVGSLTSHKERLCENFTKIHENLL